MRLSAVDVGSNSALLLIADVLEGKPPVIIDEALVTTRLGRGVEESGELSPEAVKDGLRALVEFSRRMDEAEVEAYLAVATGLLRRADNWQNFSDRVYEQIGLRIALITPRKEAELSFLSVITSLELHGDVAVLDIGAGSAQLSLGSGAIIRESVSLPLGSLRLTERFIPEAPTSNEDLSGLQDYIRKQLQEEEGGLPRNGGGLPLVVVGGTAVALIALKLGLSQYHRDAIHGKSLTTDDVAGTVAALTPLGQEERGERMPFEPERAAIILAGAVVLQEFMRLLEKDAVQVCWWGLSYGLLLRLYEILAEE